MRSKKITILLILFVFLVSFVPFGGTIKADEGYGVVATDQGEMYRDTHGNLFPVIIDSEGKKEVKLNEYEIAPLEALLERDAKISKGKSALPEEILKKFYGSKVSLSTYSYVTLPAIYSYKQGYWRWVNEWLGIHERYTIGDKGCFLTSSAMMLATYNLTINGSVVDPLNLNTWLGDHNGFDWDDGLIFGAIADFPGISSVGYFESCSDAAIAIYYHIVPIIAVHHPGLHFCVLVKTNGEKDTATNYIVNTYDAINFTSSEYAPERMYYAPYDNIAELSNYYSTLVRVGYTFADSDIFRTAYPQ